MVRNPMVESVKLKSGMPRMQRQITWSSSSATVSVSLGNIMALVRANKVPMFIENAYMAMHRLYLRNGTYSSMYLGMQTDSTPTARP